MKRLVYLVVALLIVSFAVSVGGGSRIISLGKSYPTYGIFYAWVPGFGGFEFGSSSILQICGPDDRT